MSAPSLRTLAHAAQAAIDAHLPLPGGAKASAHAQMAKAKARQTAQAALDAMAPVLGALLPPSLQMAESPAWRLDGKGALVTFSYGRRGTRANVAFRAHRIAAVAGAVNALATMPTTTLGKAWRRAEGDAVAPFVFFGPIATALIHGQATQQTVSRRVGMQALDHIVGWGQDPWDALRWLVVQNLILSIPRADEPHVNGQRGWDAGAAWATSLLPKRMPLWSALPTLVHRLPDAPGLHKQTLTSEICAVLCHHHLNRGLAAFQEAAAVADDALRSALVCAQAQNETPRDCLLLRPASTPVYGAQVHPSRFFGVELAKATPTIMSGVDRDWRGTWMLRDVGSPLPTAL